MTVIELYEQLGMQIAAGHGHEQAVIYNDIEEGDGIVHNVKFLESRREFPYVKSDHPHGLKSGVFIYGD